MSRYISENVRLEVATRANFKCEYCLVHEEDLFFTYQVDHIVSIKHGGENNISNFAYACSVCNQFKGTDLGTYLPGINRLIRLFNPRRDKWSKHFTISDGIIISKTLIGEATIKILSLNQPDRVLLRQVLVQAGRYPSA